MGWNSYIGSEIVFWGKITIESVFSPNQYDFQKAFEILEKQDNFILEGLGIKIEQEI